MRTRRRVVNVCVMRGFYDEAGEYREETMENVGIYELPKMPQKGLTSDTI